MRLALRISLVVAVCLGSVGALPALAADDAMPQVLLIYREEVKPGKNAAHEANELGWPAAYARFKMPTNWLALTSKTGPNEAWYLYGFSSLEDWEKYNRAEETNEGLSAETKKLSTQDGEMLSRTSSIITQYRPLMSYNPRGSLADMRYMRVTLTRVKAGHGREFVDLWKDIVAAHAKGKLDEHWSFYEVTSGMPVGTFFYMQAFKTLAEVDALGPMHTGASYRDAVGEEGRVRQRELGLAAVEFSQDQLFDFSPKMSYVPKAWVDADPAYWAPKPPAPAKKN